MPEAAHTHTPTPLAAIASARPLTPQPFGAPYDASLHGARIKPPAACSAVYDFDGSAFGAFAEKHGIPTDAPIPQQAFRLVNEAWAMERAPINPRADLIMARDERREALLDGARAVIALEAINRFEAANTRLGVALHGLGEAIAAARADLGRRAA
nr:hypothetical protein [uncultured Acidocella sp.]